jgi:site-specific DNA-methyltransferase (adenine-specific)
MTDGKGEVYGGMKRKGVRSENEYGYPKTILNDIPVVTNMSKEKFVHPTQKPVALLEYLIKTYTNENETVLDFTMGSGSTGVACKNLNRNFIGIELDEHYFKIASERINKPKDTLF